MLAYERASWTDEEMNPTASRDEFKLPAVEGGLARWRWVDGSKWEVDGTSSDGGDDDDKGWIYYDNKVRAIQPPLRRLLYRRKVSKS